MATELAYDPNNPLSRVVPSAYLLRDAVVAAPGFLALLPDAAIPLHHVIVGQPEHPWDRQQFTREELERQLCLAVITSTDDFPLTASEPPAMASCPPESYGLLLQVRRHVTRHDLATESVGGDIYLAFWDAISSLPLRLSKWLWDNGAQVANVVGSPYVAWSSEKSSVAQGSHLVGQLTVQFGTGGGE